MWSKNLICFQQNGELVPNLRIFSLHFPHLDYANIFSSKRNFQRSSSGMCLCDSDGTYSTSPLTLAPSRLAHLLMAACAGRRGRPRRMKPCFCSAHLPLSLPPSLPLSPLSIVKMKTDHCHDVRRSLSCEWAGGRSAGRDGERLRLYVSSLKLNFSSFFSFPVVEDDEDDFPSTRTDGEFLHNNHGIKEKCE